MPLAKFQAGFILGVVKPLFVSLHQVEYVDVSVPLRHLEENLQHWQQEIRHDHGAGGADKGAAQAQLAAAEGSDSSSSDSDSDSDSERGRTGSERKASTAMSALPPAAPEGRRRST